MTRSATLEQELHQKESEYGHDDPRLQESIEPLIDAYMSERKFEQSLTLAARSLTLSHDDRRAGRVEKVAWLNRLLGRREDASKNITELTGIKHDLPADNGRQWRVRANFEIAAGELAAAKESLKQWLEICPDDDVDYTRAWCLLCLSAVARIQDDATEAAAFAEAASAIIKDKCASGYAVDHLSLAELVNIYLLQERYHEALDVAACTLVESEDSSWGFNPLVGDALVGLADHFRGQRKFKQAESLYKRSLTIKEKLLDDIGTDYGDTAFKLATMYLSKKRYSETEMLLKAALRSRVKTHGLEHPTVAAGIETYAVFLRNTKRASLASKLDARAREIRDTCVAEFDRAAKAK